MSQTSTAVETEVVTKKKSGGRPVNPNNMGRRSEAILSQLKPEELKRDIAVAKLVAELNCKESSAATYYYTFKAKQGKTNTQ